MRQCPQRCVQTARCVHKAWRQLCVPTTLRLVYILAHVHIHTSAYTYIHTHAYIMIHTRTRAHTHTHTCKLRCHWYEWYELRTLFIPIKDQLELLMYDCVMKQVNCLITSFSAFTLYWTIRVCICVFCVCVCVFSDCLNHCKHSPIHITQDRYTCVCVCVCVLNMFLISSNMH